MSMGIKGCLAEVWPLVAGQHGIMLASGMDAWRSPEPIAADDRVEWEVWRILGNHGAVSLAPILLELIHSTSWREDEATPHLIVTWVAVLPSTDLVLDRWRDAKPVSPRLLPVVGNPEPHAAAEVPQSRRVDVLHHALRHLTFLREYDAGAREALSGHWPRHLAALTPALAGMYGAGVWPVELAPEPC